MTGPLVTVVTGTWGRPRTIFERAIPSIQAQTYNPIQHIIVTDGYSVELNRVFYDAGYSETGIMKRLVQLGRNWTGFSGDGAQGAMPRLIGALLAAGDYIAYLDDDNEYLPSHIGNLAAALDAGHDLAFSRYQSPAGYLGGAPPGATPGIGNSDASNFMHRAELLKTSMWALDGYEGDGQLVKRWVTSGCRWTLVDEPTLILYPARHGFPDSPGGE